AGRHGEDDRRHDSRDNADAEQDQRGDEVDEGRHRLQEVEDRLEDSRGCVGASRQNAEGHADDDGDEAGDENERQGVHRVLPLVDHEDQGEPEDHAEGEFPSFGQEGKSGNREDDHPERRRLEDEVDEVVCAEEDASEHVEEGLCPVGEPVDEAFDPGTERNADVHQLKLPSFAVSTSSAYAGRVISTSSVIPAVSRSVWVITSTATVAVDSTT